MLPWPTKIDGKVLALVERILRQPILGTELIFFGTKTAHASATVRMDPHVTVFQRAPANVSLRIRFRTFLPALKWAV